MTITLDLTPEEHAILRRRAEAEGTDIEAVLRGLIARLTPPPASTLMPGAVPDDPEERAERDRERAEVQANLERWRSEQGRPPLG